MQPENKKWKIQMDLVTIAALDSSEEGSQPLRQPNVPIHSSVCPQVQPYLIPKPPRLKRQHSQSNETHPPTQFVTAASFLENSGGEFKLASNYGNSSTSFEQSAAYISSQHSKRKKTISQSNKIVNYFNSTYCANNDQQSEQSAASTVTSCKIYSPLVKINGSHSLYTTSPQGQVSPASRINSQTVVRKLDMSAVTQSGASSGQITNSLCCTNVRNCGASKRGVTASTSTGILVIDSSDDDDFDMKMKVSAKRSWSKVNVETDDHVRQGTEDDNDIAVMLPVTASVNQGQSFGLLGEECEESLSQGRGDTMPELPVEIMQVIFSHLPLWDLCLNMSRVCRYWRNIIASNQFVEWKRRYHQWLAGGPGVADEMKVLLQSHGFTVIDTCLPQLVRVMSVFKKSVHQSVEESMKLCLRGHCKYKLASHILQHRLPDIYSSSEVKGWMLVAVLVLVSEDVRQVSGVIQRLTSAHCQCQLPDVVEAMYCMATFLLALRHEDPSQAWTGIHYRLFYALYLFENAGVTMTSDLSALHQVTGQQSIYKYSEQTALRMTHEQMRICNHNLAVGEVVKIVAFAGTGKTTTLLRYTQLRPNKRFLIIVYNKSVSEQIRQKFPANVNCLTGHALAFKHTGVRYKPKLGNVFLSTLVGDVVPYKQGQSVYAMAKLCLETVNTFLSSADEFITTHHVPLTQVNDNNIPVEIPHSHRMDLVDYASDLWQRMQNINDKQYKMSHDGYLKLFQLRKHLYTHTVRDDYDVLLIDEAQDLTPAMVDIITSLPQAKMLVGDPYQQIYAWRGAVNAMDHIRATRTFYLTQSFRFGPEIAHVAATCLDVLKGVKKKILVGNALQGCVTGVREGQLAVISRTNYELFREVANYCQQDPDNVKVAFIGGKDTVGFDKLLELYALTLKPEDRLKEKLTIRAPVLKHFEHQAQAFFEFKNYAKQASDMEWLGKVRVVETYMHTLPSIIKLIESRTIPHTDFADVVFSTCHKAKGLEFSTVKLTSDFLDERLFSGTGGVESAVQQLMTRSINGKKVLGEESNLLYVAVTRAKKSLLLTESLLALLRSRGEHFIRPRLTECTAPVNTSAAPTTTSVVQLSRPALTLANGAVLPAYDVPMPLSAGLLAWSTLLFPPQPVLSPSQADDDMM